MEHFFIVTNDGKDKGQKVTGEVIRILEASKKRCTRCLKDENKRIIKESIPEQFDCVVVIGGDGTLIEAARALHGRNIPILGINMGTLGYLAEVEVGYIEEALSSLISGKYEVENRMMLEGKLGESFQDVSLNDIVVARSASLRLIHFRLYVNGELLNSYEADGVIISTPTGSTAYNLSAGGPIVEPTAEMIVITPICSHALNTSSIVLSAEDELVIEIGEGKHNTIEEACIAFDGSDTIPMVTGDRVIIRRSGAAAKIIKLNKVSFLETLRRKMKESKDMKAGRHRKIIELISTCNIETQEDLAARLNEEGFQVTQATVSRDIRELKLTKVPAEGGGQRYAVHQSTGSAMNEKYMRVLKDGFVSMDMAQNILVIKTVSGMAMAVCAAIDAMKWEEVVGSIAGDDTIMCAIRTVEDTLRVIEKINRIVL